MAVGVIDMLVSAAKKTLAATWEWIMAGLVLFIVGMLFWVFFIHGENQPCTSKPCYTVLDKRIDELKTMIECPNNNCDRFRGKDARAMEQRLRDDIAALRRETNERIDKMHED